MRRPGIIVVILSLLFACTEVEDRGGPLPVGPGPGPSISDACAVCAVAHRACVQEQCADCLTGFVDYGDGACVSPPSDPCSLDPCAAVHKNCLGGLCGGCLAGFEPDEHGNCIAPSPCYPNPCKEDLRTYCTLGEGGAPVCLCSPGTHEGAGGDCTYDPCDPSPCVEPLGVCFFSGPLPECGCPEGSLILDGACADDPCVPNPCEGYAASSCELTEEGGHVCSCDPGFIQDESGACIEVAVVNGTSQQPAEEDVEVDYSRQYFVDDFLVHSRTNTARRLHSAIRPPGELWVVDPELDQGVRQAAANGSLVHVPEEARAVLAEDHPLKLHSWRLYYQAYRPPPDGLLQPSWLCIAAAATPSGPWIKPVLTEGDPLSHCVLRQDGISRNSPAEVSLANGQWVLSVTRSKLGSVSEPGLYVYTSDDGIEWWLDGDGAPVIPVSDTPVPPAAYPRIGERSRLIWDSNAARFVGLFSLPSQALGDARGLMNGTSDPLGGWDAAVDPVQAPAILGPQLQEKAQGYVYGDMTAWRDGDLWWGLVQKRQTVCPKATYASLATSRDGRHWYMVQDEATGGETPVLAPHPAAGEPDSALTSFTGGPPGEHDGFWHFFVGGLSAPQFGSEAEGCSPAPPEGGIGHLVVRAGGFAGIATYNASQGVIVTRPLRMKEGYTGSILEVDAYSADGIDVQVEALTIVDTSSDIVEEAVGPGNHQYEQVAFLPLNTITEDRFRLRFTLHGASEVYGFRFADPLCSPNPCEEPARTICDSSTGKVLCLCNPPLHDDGQGECTDNPCLPDPCTGPHEQGCEVVDGSPLCGCADGWAPVGGVCVVDPCLGLNGVLPCVPPDPDRCRVLEDGTPECYCPEGSLSGATGCYEIHPRAFVTSMTLTGGEIAGLESADALCNILAAGAELGGDYVAWLSTGDSSAAGRLGDGGPWRTWDSQLSLWTRLVAQDLPDLTDGALQSPMDRTEVGAAVDGGCQVWTGTLEDGSPVESGLFAGDCAAWTTGEAGHFSLSGLCGSTDASWTAWSPAQCGKSYRLYCFETSDTDGEDGLPDADPDQ